MNKENVNPNRRENHRRMNQKLDQELKFLSERADPRNVICEIQEIHRLVRTQDDFIEILNKDILKRDFREDLEQELIALGKKIISQDRHIGILNFRFVLE